MTLTDVLGMASGQNYLRRGGYYLAVETEVGKAALDLVADENTAAISATIELDGDCRQRGVQRQQLDRACYEAVLVALNQLQQPA